jgi:multiple sugar transport system substrate-binding protein
MRAFHLLLVLALLTLSGCQNGTPTPPPVTATGAATATVAAASPTSPPESVFAVTPDALRELTIEVWHPWTGAMGHLLENQIGAFNLQNPWGIQVRGRAFSGFSELQATLRESLKASEVPDLAILLSEQASEWAAQQVLVDLAPYLNDPVYGLQQAEIADFYPAIWAQDAPGLQRWGMPAQRSGRVLLYNQSWAQELGFSMPPVGPQEFRQQACAAARAAGNGRGGWYLDTHPMTALSWIYAFNGEIVEGQGYRFLQPANLSAFTFLKALFDDGCSWREAQTDPIQAFSTRQALFLTLGIEELPAVERAFASQGSRDRWRVIAFAADFSFVSYGASYVLFKTSEARQLAGWLFMRWLLRPENQAAMVKGTGFLPLTRSAFDRLSDYAAEHEAWKQAVEWLPNARPAPTLASWRQVKWMLGDGFEEIFRRGLESGQIPLILAELDRGAQDVSP